MISRLETMVGLTAALIRGGQRREAALAQLLRPANLFQPFTTTGADRYPDEFAAVAEGLETPEPIVLSFGCASGDELFSVRSSFPASRVHGVDINPLAVRTARRRVQAAGDPRITVARGSDGTGLPESAYDVVLALAVFRHGALKAKPASCAQLLRFGDFERTVGELCSALKPGGLFVIRHANFRFTDTQVGAGFTPVRVGFASVDETGPTPIYGSDDRLVPGAVGDDGVYRK